jgi:hypothetical protein
MADAVEYMGSFHAGDTAVCQFPIVDGDTGIAFKPTDLYVELFDEETGSTINGRDGVSNLIASYSDASQKVIFQLAVADVALVNTKITKIIEKHRLVFRWTWSAGAKVGSRVFNFEVRDRRAASDTP